MNSKKRYDKKELWNKFIEIYSDYKIGFTQRTFSSWIKNYAKLKGLKFEVKNSGNSKGFILTKDLRINLYEWTEGN